MIHESVLLKETLGLLKPKKGETVLDATVDGGGHALEICKLIGKEGKLIGIDQDPRLMKEAEKRLSGEKCGVVLLNGNFRHLDELLRSVNVGIVDVVLFDLGMSSLQLEDSKAGFSFLKDEPLIMNYSQPLQGNELTAQEIVNSFPEEEIFEILKNYGEERYARRISRNIADCRKREPIKTTFDLVKIISRSVPHGYERGRIHFATRTFQALRIAVNDELDALKEGLMKAWRVLKVDGRIAVISFHSLEDRIVKNYFKEKAKEGSGLLLVKKPVIAGENEIKFNPRSRSAKLRAIVKKAE